MARNEAQNIENAATNSAQVVRELPPKVETVMRVELSGEQADLCETIRLGMEKIVCEALTAKGIAKSQTIILDALLKLRQVCCAPYLLKLDAAKKIKTSVKLEQLIERLTKGEVPLFLISLKAGGVGLNLLQADTVINYDPWWNPAAEAQATLEERILALQDRKAALAESMYSGPSHPLRRHNACRCKRYRYR